MVKIEARTLEQELSVYRVIDEVGDEPIEVQTIADGEVLRLQFEDERYFIRADGEVIASDASDEDVLAAAMSRARTRKIRLQRDLLNVVLRAARKREDVASFLPPSSGVGG